MEAQGNYQTAMAVIPEGAGVAALTPRQQVEKASEMAKVLQQVVSQAKLARNFGGKKDHLEYEAWQTIGQFFNCTPVTDWTHPIKEGEKIIGYEARVNVIDSNGRIIASAESMCMRDEPNWRNKPLYSLRSMAQTRTAGKALRSVFAWVAVLAGYSATPAEEMSGVTDEIPEPKVPRQDQQEQPAQKPAGAMTDKQRGLLWHKCKEATLSETEAKAFLKWFCGRDEKLTSKEASKLIDAFDKNLEVWQKEQAASKPKDETVIDI